MSFTDTQVSQLSAPLPRSNVKTRQQAGRNLSYIEAWKAIDEANRIFGFGEWSSETIECRCVAEKPRKIGKGTYEKDGHGVSYVARVRITVKTPDGLVTREGVGAGHGIDADLGLAHESAIKESESDARKRALMTFGNPFGLALYDKDQENVSDDTNTETRAPEQRPARQEQTPAAGPSAPVDPKVEALKRQTEHATRSAELQKSRLEEGKSLYQSHSKAISRIQERLDIRAEPVHQIARDWSSLTQTIKASIGKLTSDDQRVLRSDAAEVSSSLKHAEKFETVAA